MVMRATVVLLSGVAALSALTVLVFGAGSGTRYVDASLARIGLSALVGAAVIAISYIGRGGPDLDDERHLAVSLFQIGTKRVLSAAAVGPGGFILSWLAADATYVIFGAGLALLLMAVVAPTVDRIAQWQAEVDEAGSDLSVGAALGRPWR